MPRTRLTLLAISTLTACLPFTLQAQAPYRAVPGTISFTQGQVNIDGQPLGVPGTAANHLTPARQLAVGQTLATAQGSVDILLAPGALLRLGDDSTVRMLAANGGRTEVRLEQGRANLSINLVRANHLLLVDLKNGQAQIVSPGLYTANAGSDTFRVFQGEALIFRGSDTESDIKPVSLKEGREITLDATGKVRPEKFDRELADDDLLPWTGPREAEAALAGDGAGSDWGTGGGAYATYASGGYGFAGPAFYDGPFGWGDPYGYGWGPYGFGGYPFFGAGFGFWGGAVYGGGYRSGPPLKGPGRFGGRAPGTGAGHAMAPFATHGGGFNGGHGFAGGGGMHIGGGGGHR